MFQKTKINQQRNFQLSVKGNSCFCFTSLCDWFGRKMKTNRVWPPAFSRAFGSYEFSLANDDVFLRYNWLQ